MQEQPALLRRQIKIRLREKRLNTSAKTGILWLSMGADLLFIVFLLRTSMRISSSGFAIPPLFAYGSLPLLFSYYFFYKAGRCIANSEILIAAKYMSLISWMGSLAALLIAGGILEWFSVSGISSRVTLLGITIGFFVINVITGIALLHRVGLKLRSFQIHSMDQHLFIRVRTFWNFLGILWSLLLVAVILLSR